MAPQNVSIEHPPTYAEVVGCSQSQQESRVSHSPSEQNFGIDSTDAQKKHWDNEAGGPCSNALHGIEPHQAHILPTYDEVAAQESGLTDDLPYENASNTFDHTLQASNASQNVNEKPSKRYRRLHRAEEVASSLFATAVLAAVFIGFV
ncbi:uncharacterized protein AB675_5536 [Cyphellophora attinorum]|uniref:Uncharacterized protein n=1 Tax=Cyphellophora attinorum TaxID=1664694 RepID=A0A0N1NZL8_9EURO|nr:uncharacterized protein AB675_5536 [Phialophora attinorum]KPI41802.1 hypothetical protein AB675_5536 [Phialophora attinorum]